MLHRTVYFVGLVTNNFLYTTHKIGTISKKKELPWIFDIEQFEFCSPKFWQRKAIEHLRQKSVGRMSRYLRIVCKPLMSLLSKAHRYVDNMFVCLTTCAMMLYSMVLCHQLSLRCSLIFDYILQAVSSKKRKLLQSEYLVIVYVWK